jgi:hypothetical protein
MHPLEKGAEPQGSDGSDQRQPGAEKHEESR